MTILEKQIEEWLRKQVEKMGGEFYKFVSPGNNGVPDRIAVLPGGRIWFIELKADNGVVAPLQKWQLGKLTKLGANAIIIRGFDEAHDWSVERWTELEADDSKEDF